MFGLAPYQGGPGTEQPGGQAGYAQRAPSNVWDWYHQVRALENRAPDTPLQSAVTGLRQNGVAALSAAALGFISGEFNGLDFRGKYPLDALAALGCYFLSVKSAGQPDGFASDLRAISQSCTSVYAFRTTEKWRENAKEVNANPPPTVAGRVNTHRDSILEAGARIGL